LGHAKSLLEGCKPDHKEQRMRKSRLLAKVLPALAVAGVLAASALVAPAQVLALLTGYGTAYSYGGVIKSGPAAASGSASISNVFAHGTDDALWQAGMNGGGFNGWTRIGGTMILDPGAVSPAGTTGVFVAVEGTNGVTWTKYSTNDGATFGPWTSQGGVTIAGPGVAASFVSSVLRVDIFVVGGDGSIWTKSSADGTTFGAWSKIGGVVTEKPGAVAWGSGQVNLFVRGTDMGLWTMTITNGVPGPWTSLGGILLSGVAATSCASGHMDIYVVGTGGALWHRGYNTTLGVFNGWEQGGLGGTWTSNLGAECQAGTQNVTVFGRGTDGALWSWGAPGT
jgi:hypothetical protein